jgi:hypothetical protein
MSEALRIDPSAAGPTLARDLPADPAEAREAVHRAALTVGSFAQASALDTLDALLGRAGTDRRDTERTETERNETERADDTPTEIARQACARTDLLDREVRRFRRLANPAD